VAGCRAFLEASLDPEVQRIMLIDAPAVLGWDVWRQMDAEYSMKSLHQGVHMLVQQGAMRPLPIDALVNLLSGAMNEAALWIARSPEPHRALEEAISTLEQLLEGVRTGT
jgi:hypothetical protein